MDPVKIYASPAERRSAKEKRRKQHGKRKEKNDGKIHAMAAMKEDSAISQSKIKRGTHPRECVVTLCCRNEKEIYKRYYYATDWDLWYATCRREHKDITCPFCRAIVTPDYIIRFTLKAKKKSDK